MQSDPRNAQERVGTKDVWANPVDAAAQQLLERGYAVLTQQADLTRQVDTIFAEALRFFAQPQEVKLQLRSESLIEGYLPLGTEFSRERGRPDLCESFAVWGINGHATSVLRWAKSVPLHKAMTAALADYTTLANAIFSSLQQRIAPQGDKLLASEYSYLQLNHYRPADYSRDLLQDPHEDGHLLTILRPSALGAEIMVNGQFIRVALAPDQFLLMPGSLLTEMTGGKIQPLVHRVRNDQSTRIRQSLMFFINPSLAQHLTPWASPHGESAARIHQMLIENSQNFGLASVENLRTD